MDDIYFISASIITVFLVTAVPLRYYLQVTEPLSKQSRLYQFRDKLKLMPMLATSGVILFFSSLSLESRTGAFFAYLLIVASLSISLISALYALTNPQCRERSSQTPVTRTLGILITGAGRIIVTFIKALSFHSLKARYRADSLNGENDTYQETHEFERSQGLLDEYGRYKD